MWSIRTQVEAHRRRAAAKRQVVLLADHRSASDRPSITARPLGRRGGRLVEIARHSACSHLETACRHIVRSRAAGDDCEQAAHRTRRLRTWWSAHGLRIDGQLGAEAGAILRTALDRAVEELPDDTVGDADDSRGARQADALELLARAFLETGDEEQSVSGPPPGHLSVHIGLEWLLGHSGPDVEPCRIDGADGPTAEDKARSELCRLGWHGPGVADGLVRRLCCDATIQAVVRDSDGNPLALDTPTEW